METVVNVHEAKNHFSKLLERTANGEEIIIAKAGHPIARLTCYAPMVTMVREPGSMKGQIHMTEDFNASLPEDLLVAHCLAEPLLMLTADAKLSRYGPTVLVI